MDSRDSLNQTPDSIDLTVSLVKYKNAQRDTEKSNEDTSDNDTDKMIQFNKNKARKIYGRDIKEKWKIIKLVKSNKGRTIKVYAINREKENTETKKRKSITECKK